MASRLGHNIPRVTDKQRLWSHLDKLRPPATQFYFNDVETARECKQRYPDMTVILRVWQGDLHDEETHLKVTPRQWLTRFGHLAQGGLWLSTTNEAGLSEQLVNWHCDLMPLALAEGVPLVIWNPAGGSYEKSHLPLLRPMLDMASALRETVIVGIHAYAGGAITSGIAFKEMQNSTPVRIKPPWSTKGECAGLTKYHIGRQEWISTDCKQRGKPVRVGLTETSFDHTGDLADWLSTLKRSGGESKVRGWRSLEDQWGEWWPEWTAARAYVEQMRWAEAELMTDVEFALLYQSGSPDPDWKTHRIDTSEVYRYLEETIPAKRTTQTNPVVIPVLPGPDDPRWERRQAVITSLQLPVVIRPSQNPNDLTPNVGTIRTGDELYVIQAEFFGKYEAVMIGAERGIGWVQSGLVNWGSLPGSPPPPPAPDIPAAYKQIADAYRHISQGYEKLAEHYSRLSAFYEGVQPASVNL